jgi:ADP-ribose 1''-phosphate phosphatase
MIKYIKGDLFQAPKGSVLLHSCNCQGVWGSGVAAAFFNKFPQAYKVYKEYCTFYNPIGTSLSIQDKDYTIGCLFTSKDYGQNKDSVDQILKNTEKAIKDLLLSSEVNEFHLPKINSGLFGVPWEKTEEVLNTFDATFIVYEL